MGYCTTAYTFNGIVIQLKDLLLIHNIDSSENIYEFTDLHEFITPIVNTFNEKYNTNFTIFEYLHDVVILHPKRCLQSKQLWGFGESASVYGVSDNMLMDESEKQLLSNLYNLVMKNDEPILQKPHIITAIYGG